MELNFKTYGEGTPLLILHGLFGSSDNWMSIARHLGEKYKVYLPDLRNHGKSPWDDIWTYEVMSQDVAKFVQQEGIQDPIVMGHSMGGKVAMLFAANQQEVSTKKLIVVDIAPKSYPVHHDHIIEALKSLNLPELASRKDADEALATHLPDKAVRQFLLKNLGRNEEKNFVWELNLDVIDRNIGMVGEAFPRDLSYEGPTLFIRGRLSNYIKDEDEGLLKECFPQAELVTVKDAGHWVHAEQPEAFLKALEEFLKE